VKTKTASRETPALVVIVPLDFRGVNGGSSPRPHVAAESIAARDVFGPSRIALSGPYFRPTLRRNGFGTFNDSPAPAVDRDVGWFGCAHVSPLRLRRGRCLSHDSPSDPFDARNGHAVPQHPVAGRIADGIAVVSDCCPAIWKSLESFAFRWCEASDCHDGIAKHSLVTAAAASRIQQRIRNRAAFDIRSVFAGPFREHEWCVSNNERWFCNVFPC